MSTHEHDDRFNEWLKDAARGYNRPPDIVPRDAMWDDLKARGSRVDGRGAKREGRRLMAFPIWSLAAAAVLLLAVGIGLGRLTMGRTGVTIAGVDSSVRAPARDSVGSTLPNAVVAGTQRETAGVVRNPNATRDPNVKDPAFAELGGESRGRLYDIAATQYLTAAEALLTTFRAARDTTMDDVMRRWARDLLSTTRLLLDSPAGGDAQRRRLLEDLEFVLVQMVKLPANDARFDRELIERSISRQQVLTRIRTSIPAGTASGT